MRSWLLYLIVPIIQNLIRTAYTIMSDEWRAYAAIFKLKKNNKTRKVPHLQRASRSFEVFMTPAFSFSFW